MIRSIHTGLGPIGLQILAATVDERIARPVAAADIDPKLCGCPLGQVLIRPELDAVFVRPDLESAITDAENGEGADVVVLATGSFLPDIADQILLCVDRGLNVVSTSEQLNWPWLRSPDLADEIDARAKDRGVTVVGTGINPGLLLDLLPLLLCRPSLNIRRVTARRIVNVSLRRPQLQRKVGSAMSPEEYRQLADQGLVGHVGLAESAAMLAAGLGWAPVSVDETIAPVIATEQTGTEHFTIEPGQVMGSHQEARVAGPDGKEIHLVCRMTHGEADPRDEIEIDGDPPVNMRIENGIFGDTATAGCTAKILRLTVEAKPGLLTVKDLPVA
ncbi:MAG: dihydrodipicolinate reductase [Armatimonadetes bacterium]|nr:dihydrodipicolinate reductase [Armatimonadota bacterium]